MIFNLYRSGYQPNESPTSQRHHDALGFAINGIRIGDDIHQVRHTIFRNAKCTPSLNADMVRLEDPRQSCVIDVGLDASGKITTIIPHGGCTLEINGICLLKQGDPISKFRERMGLIPYTRRPDGLLDYRLPGNKELVEITIERDHVSYFSLVPPIGSVPRKM